MSDYKTILVTGGAGFVGSHIVDGLVRNFPDATIKVIDKLTYAGDTHNLSDALAKPNVSLVVGDICDWDFVEMQMAGIDLVVHAAAESHVDRSFNNAPVFMQTNIIGSQYVLEACRIQNVKKLIHISTDEVYGTVLEGYKTEGQTLDPTNPYAASKAAADMLIQANVHAYGQPVVVVRPNNIFGTRQWPEKLLPKFILCLINGMPLPVHGNGSQTRTFLSVHDLVNAIVLLIDRGENGQIYNIGTEEEYSVLDIVRVLCRAFRKEPGDYLKYVEDRPFNDMRYGIGTAKIRELGWQPCDNLMDSLSEIIDWHQSNYDRLMEKIVQDSDFKLLAALE